MSAQSRLVQLGLREANLLSKRKPYFSIVVCTVIEFRQFTGITFGKAKGRLEVTVSAWVSG